MIDQKLDKLQSEKETLSNRNEQLLAENAALNARVEELEKELQYRLTAATVMLMT